MRLPLDYNEYVSRDLNESTINCYVPVGDSELQRVAVLEDADGEFVGLVVSGSPIFWQRYLITLKHLIAEVTEGEE